MKKTLIIFGILIFSTTIYSQQNTWTKKMKFGGEKRDRAVAFSVGLYGYIATGEDTVSMTHNDLWKYDPVLDAWSQQMDLPAATRRNAVAVTIGDKGYVGLGIDSSVAAIGVIHQDWWQYDPVANNWVQKANYPGGIDQSGFSGSALEGVYYATAFEANGKGYVCGGKMGSDLYGTDLWEYDPNTDAWTRMADFPGSDRYQLSSMGIDGKGYVGFGIDHDLYRKDWWEYDPTTNTWLAKSNLPGVERGAASTFVLSQRGYLVFGSDGGYKDELWEYNPFSDSWNIKANYPGGERKNAVAFSIGNIGYGGTGKGPTGIKRNFYEYSPLLPIGINEEEITAIIYPNPIDNMGIIKINDADLANTYSIIGLNGKLIEQGAIQQEQTEIYKGEKSTGVYILLLTNKENNIVSTQQIIFK